MKTILLKLFQVKFLQKLLVNFAYIAFEKDNSKAPRLYKALENIGDNEIYKDKRNMSILKKDLIFCRYVLGFTYEEYFYFHLENKSLDERKEYVGTFERYYYWKNLSSKETQAKFDNKYTAYELFKNYYKRDVIKIENKSDFSTFNEFVKNHDSYIVKPLAYSLGQGIFTVDVDEADKTVQELFDDILSKGACVVEELVYQSFDMAVLHPSSVNTVRFATYYDSSADNVTRLYAMLRMGCGDSQIDNAFCGGIAAPVDVDSGIVTGKGYRNVNGKEEWFEYQPETRAKIIGKQLPDWQNLLSMLEELARVVPEQKIVGWDLAHTDDGWVMIEGNSRPILKAIQMCSGRGLRKEFELTKNH